MAHNKKNFAVGLIATAPTPALSGTSMILYPGQGTRMPATPFYLTVAPQGVLTTLDTAEVIEVTNVSSDTLTIVRAQKGTAAKEIGVDWLVSNGIYTEDLDEYEPLLPETPLDPSNKFLNGNKAWSSIPTGATGFAGNVYYTTTASDVAGYYKLSYEAQPTETVLTGTVNNNEVLFRTYLYDEALGVDSIDSGIWSTVSWVYVSSATGVTQLKLEPFVRHTNGTETTLFSDYSDDINNTTRTRLKDEVTQLTFTVDPTDRLGVRVYGKTTANTNITVSTVIGDGDASYFTTPLRIRHTQLRDLNGDTSNVHVTATEKTAITHTNRTALDNVSGTNTGDQVADGVTITGAGTIADPFVGVGSNQLITDETPTGLVNGANLNYTVAHAYTPGTMQVYINGVKKVRGTHFTEVGPGYTIFTMSNAPLTGDVISVNYQTTVSTSGNADTVDGYHANATPTANQIPVLDGNGKTPTASLYQWAVDQNFGNGTTTRSSKTSGGEAFYTSPSITLTNPYNKTVKMNFVFSAMAVSQTAGQNFQIQMHFNGTRVSPSFYWDGVSPWITMAAGFTYTFTANQSVTARIYITGNGSGMITDSTADNNDGWNPRLVGAIAEVA